MPQTQTIEYPRYISISEGIEIAKKLVGTFKGNAISKDALANMLNHKNSTSGTFLVKLSDLKKLGIIEGRGDSFSTTEVAKKIAIPTDENEKNSAIREMINNVRILTQLYENLHSDTAPTDNDILIQLINITHKDRAMIRPLVAEISKLYKDALPYISMATSTSSIQMQRPTSVNNPSPNLNEILQSTDILQIKDDGIVMNIKKDKEHLETAKELLEFYIKKIPKSK